MIYLHVCVLYDYSRIKNVIFPFTSYANAGVHPDSLRSRKRRFVSIVAVLKGEADYVKVSANSELRVVSSGRFTSRYLFLSIVHIMHLVSTKCTRLLRNGLFSTFWPESSISTCTTMIRVRRGPPTHRILQNGRFLEDALLFWNKRRIYIRPKRGGLYFTAVHRQRQGHSQQCKIDKSNPSIRKLFFLYFRSCDSPWLLQCNKPSAGAGIPTVPPASSTRNQVVSFLVSGLYLRESFFWYIYFFLIICIQGCVYRLRWIPVANEPKSGAHTCYLLRADARQCESSVNIWNIFILKLHHPHK